METLETTIKVGDETILIFRHGVNDYSIGYVKADCSLRGTLMEIINDLNQNYPDIIL